MTCPISSHFRLIVFGKNNWKCEKLFFFNLQIFKLNARVNVLMNNVERFRARNNSLLHFEITSISMFFLLLSSKGVSKEIDKINSSNK